MTKNKFSLRFSFEFSFMFGNTVKNSNSNYSVSHIHNCAINYVAILNQSGGCAARKNAIYATFMHKILDTYEYILSNDIFLRREAKSYVLSKRRNFMLPDSQVTRLPLMIPK